MRHGGTSASFCQPESVCVSLPARIVGTKGHAFVTILLIWPVKVADIFESDAFPTFKFQALENKIRRVIFHVGICNEK